MLESLNSDFSDFQSAHTILNSQYSEYENSTDASEYAGKNGDNFKTMLRQKFSNDAFAKNTQTKVTGNYKKLASVKVEVPAVNEYAVTQLNLVALNNNFKGLFAADIAYEDNLDLFPDNRTEATLFPYANEFRVSPALISKFLENQRFLRSALRQPIVDVLKIAAHSNLSEEFSRVLRNAFVNWAQEQRVKAIEVPFTIFNQGRFNPQLQIRLCDSFLIVPDISSSFLELVSKDIKSFLRIGGTLEGKWGKYRLTSDQRILLELSNTATSTDPKFTRAKRLE